MRVRESIIGEYKKEEEEENRQCGNSDKMSLLFNRVRVKYLSAHHLLKECCR
ncbi:hypothetical protein, unlikely [Trypanosoma brucei brucei TREU927]|uniref:Uncharacterized protein n=1 Tax=Trypanosoma brucei brucei (strain 927/4 GUTat10.1) TaxID=185431 RepID=Q38F39_TRYB2|nr:hypothetical protein, unlikely [Trypanosoma brucei brucei TREU927]EAN76581.1 hypothetical protein, unlikely [Trypanosoma brucei brucei TREU927]